MKALLAFLLIPVSFGLYLYLETRTEFSQRVPWLHFLLAGAGIAILVVLLRSDFSWWRCVLTGLAVVLTAGFVWWTLSYSNYSDPPEKMAAQLPEDIIMVNRQSGEVSLGRMLAQSERTLAVFYRGYW